MLEGVFGKLLYYMINQALEVNSLKDMSKKKKQVFNTPKTISNDENQEGL